VLIVEGADLTGKTTLCKRLVRELNQRGSLEGEWNYSHMTAPGSRWDFYWSYLEFMRRRAVQDRFYLSELAYRGIRGDREPKLTSFESNLIRAQLILMGGLTVILTTTENGLLLAHSRTPRTEMYGMEGIYQANHWYMHDPRSQGDHGQTTLKRHQGSGQQWPAEDNEFVKVVIENYVEKQVNLANTLARKTETRL